jgi:hypothetical protein
MVVVDALRDARHGAIFSEPMVERLHGAVANAHVIIQFLLRDTSWSADWTQAHTMKAILTRLDQTDDNPSAGEQEISAEQNFPTETVQSAHNNGAIESNDWNMSINGEDYVNSALQSTDWDAFFAIYDQEFNWSPLNEFDINW